MVLNRVRMGNTRRREEEKGGSLRTANPETCREKVGKDYPGFAIWSIGSINTHTFIQLNVNKHY